MVEDDETGGEDNDDDDDGDAFGLESAARNRESKKSTGSAEVRLILIFSWYLSAYPMDRPIRSLSRSIRLKLLNCGRDLMPWRIM
jgi:hypothetical protein